MAWIVKNIYKGILRTSSTERGCEEKNRNALPASLLHRRLECLYLNGVWELRGNTPNRVIGYWSGRDVSERT